MYLIDKCKRKTHLLFFPPNERREEEREREVGKPVFNQFFTDIFTCKEPYITKVGYKEIAPCQTIFTLRIIIIIIYIYIDKQ